MYFQENMRINKYQFMRANRNIVCGGGYDANGYCGNI